MPERVEERSSLGLFTDYGQVQSEFVNELVLANLTNIEAVLGYALVHILLWVLTFFKHTEICWDLRLTLND